MSESATQQSSVQKSSSSLQKYLDRAMQVLERFKILPADETPELVRLLEEVRHVDEAKVLAIANTVKNMAVFNQMVRDNVEDIRIGNRYLEITQMFDSIREDSKKLIAQLDDGRLSLPERMQNLWMKISRGSPYSRFEKITELYTEVADDTNDQLKTEEAVMDGYIDFRFAVKEAEILARELLATQTENLELAKAELAAAQRQVDNDQSDDSSRQSRLELARDEARQRLQDEDRCYQLIKDVAENLSVGYDVGETLVLKLRQTHNVKEQVYRRAVTFFTTNEHVFTILGTVYASQHGLHEATQATEALKEGANKGLEDVAVLGRELERAALKAGYGSTISPASLEKLVEAITDFQVESLNTIAELRQESEKNAREIRRVVEEGKRRYQETLVNHALGKYEPSEKATA